MGARKFDLNIEKILEDWEVHHALREVIANAIDEQKLTDTDDIEIFQDKGKWHVRDYGRGLRYDHLTQKENEEKLSNPYMIGKFGIGLKDALATFERKGVEVTIKSSYGDITLGRSEKQDFEDIVTLHAYISQPSDPDFVGTVFILKGISKREVEKAKRLFLVFSGDTVLEETKFGSVLEKKSDTASIYVNGVRVAEEDNFLFSYNITSLTKPIRKAMNRERTNVGRSAYTDRVKAMLLSCETTKVASRLVQDLRNFQTGTIHDELGWIDVQEHAVKTLSALSRIVFFTPDQLMDAANMVDEARDSGYEIVTIPEKLREKIEGQLDVSGRPIRSLSQFTREFNESFEFKFVDREELTAAERKVFDMTDAIFELIGGRPLMIEEVCISTTMRKDPETFRETKGLWEGWHHRIVVKRSVLEGLENYAGTLLHETAHAKGKSSDCTRAFESQLTDFIGLIAARTIRLFNEEGRV